MKIRISGFQLTFHDKMDMDTLVVELQKNQGKKFRYPPHDRVLRVARDGDHILGSLLTDRGHKNFLAIDTETSELTRGTLGARKNFGAFNFFVLCRKTNAALITSYRDAGGPSFVFGAMQRFGNDGLDGLRLRKIDAAGSLTDKQRQRINQMFDPPSFEWVELLGKETYEAVLRRWEKIRFLQMEYKLVDAESAAFIPFHEDAIDKGKFELSFKRGTSVGDAVDTIKSLAKRAEVKKAEVLKIDGIDEWGIARRVELEERIPSLFGEMDHDEIIAEKTSFDPDLKKSYVIRCLKEVVRNSQTIFG